MSYNWINAENYTMDAFLLLDRWCLEYIFYGEDDEEYVEMVARALHFYPHVKYYISHKAPGCRSFIEAVEKVDCIGLTKDEARKNELQLIGENETFIVYGYPEVMNKVNYIRNWKPEYLYTLVDLTDKIVLDVGAGTGRLAFAAAAKAKRVYASEPCDQLREFMRDKIENECIENIRVLDGFVTELPFEDSTFDVVTSGHVIGDYYDEEIAELVRITKDGGYFVVCNGDDEFVRTEPNSELTTRGFTFRKHESAEGGIIYDYIKRVVK